MEISLDKHAANQASVKIKLNEADYQPKVDAKLKDYAKKAVIRGFRPGKAPISMVKNMYGLSLLVDEINSILGESLNTYLKEQTFKILGEPLPVEKADNSIDWKAEKEFEFEYKIGFVENIQIALDNSTSGIKYTIKVDDKLVNETIENLKTQYGENSNPETAEAGDAVYIPSWAWHKHQNLSDNEPAKYIACENAPQLQNLGVALREEEGRDV